MRHNIIKAIFEEKLIVIVRGFQKEEVCFFADAMKEGGVKLLEVTFNAGRPETYHETAETIQALREYLGSSMYVGAGTVLSGDLVKIAHQAGAEFIISPDTNQEVIEKTRELDLVSIPGALTPTEMVQAHSYGADFVKLFPAGDLPISYVTSLLAPLSHIPLLAVGGVTLQNIPLYLKAGVSGFGIGGGLVKRELIQNRDRMRLTSNAQEWIQKIKGEV